MIRTFTSQHAWFLARITDVLSGNRYAAEEVWAGTAGAIVTKSGGVLIDDKNPGYSVTDATFADEDIVLARQAPGAGGTLFELAPIGSGSSLAFFQSVLTTDGGGGGLGAWNEILLVGATLPETGTYLISGQVSGRLAATLAAGESALLQASLQKSAVEIGSSTVVVVQATVTGVSHYGTATFSPFEYAGTVGDVIKLYARLVLTGAPTVTLNSIANSALAYGNTRIGYMRIR